MKTPAGSVFRDKEEVRAWPSCGDTVPEGHLLIILKALGYILAPHPQHHIQQKAFSQKAAQPVKAATSHPGAAPTIPRPLQSGQ